MLKRILTSPWTALVTLALVTALRIADPAFVESVRLRYFDTLVTSKAPETIGVSIAYVWYRIDENYHDRILAKHQSKHQAEMELLRQQKLKIKS